MKNKKLYEYYRRQGERYRVSAVSEFERDMAQRLVAMTLTQRVLKTLSSYLRGSGLLDVGCGRGWYLYNVMHSCESAVGVDISWGHLKQAKLLTRDADGLSIAQGDANKLPFQDGAFDIVLAVDVLEHLMQPQEALREVRRVLRKGGKALVCVPSVLNPTEWAGRLINVVQGHFQDHLHFYTPRTAKRTMELAGFEVVYTTTCCFLPTILGGTEFRASFFRKTYSFLELKLSNVPSISRLGASIILLVTPRD
jgi:ubiquinone/menaquinone biosynthesis C-methylase UbiE